jgi:hypothetical protein
MGLIVRFRIHSTISDRRNRAASSAERVREVLLRRRLPEGGWSHFGNPQASVEATCLATLALAAGPTSSQMTWHEPLIKWQNEDGSWPSFVGDREGSWTTALGLVAVGISGGPRCATERAARWLIAMRGHEAHWLWRWKFKLAD